MTRDGDTYTLSSGRKIIASYGILGLDPVESEATIGRLTEGCRSYCDESRTVQGSGKELILTPAERREIAEYMIAQWRKWGGVLDSERKEFSGERIA